MVANPLINKKIYILAFVFLPFARSLAPLTKIEIEIGILLTNEMMGAFIFTFEKISNSLKNRLEE